MTQETILHKKGGVSSTIRRWIGISSQFALAQGFAQAAGMVVGLVFVRTMSVKEYALYAMCMTTLGFVAVGSDLGLNGSLAFFWRQSLAAGHAVGPWIAAVRRLRSWLFVASLVAGITLLVTSPVASSAPLPIILVNIVLLAGTAWRQLQNGISLQLIRLEGQQGLSFLCEAIGSVFRLIGAGVLVLTGFATAWFGLVVGILGVTAVSTALKTLAKTSYTSTSEVLPEDWRELRRYLLSVVPSVLVYMIQDPLVLWLAAKQSGDTTVAEVFALSRIGAVMALFGSFSYIVIAPELARISDNSRFLAVLATCFGGLATICTFIIIATCLAPQVPLWLIGPRYADLKIEIVICLMAVSLTLLGHLIAISNRVRGWVALDPIVSFAQLCLILILSALWSFDTTRSVVMLNLSLAGGVLAGAVATLGLGIFRAELVATRSVVTAKPD
ncbi:lipopolysaccharide biosynthesis protein [Methylocystis sp.]|uniref:lipopolysaccharide biosynthesis protein n=1 Tax=Methylocystis sp. TaxID=1911079 RepID=UPI003DA5C662